MRLDKYLKVSRLIKRRTVANEACDNERVMVNGRVQRASYDVKVGDQISLRFGQRIVTVEVLDVPGYEDLPGPPVRRHSGSGRCRRHVPGDHGQPVITEEPLSYTYRSMYVYERSFFYGI